MTNAVAKLVHCPTCGAPPGRACQPLNPEKTFIVPNHSARKKLYVALAKSKYAPVKGRRKA